MVKESFNIPAGQAQLPVDSLGRDGIYPPLPTNLVGTDVPAGCEASEQSVSDSQRHAQLLRQFSLAYLWCQKNLLKESKFPVGSSFEITVFSQTINSFGQIETKSLGLSAVLVTNVDNYVVAVVGGAGSFFNDGSFFGVSEPAVGVMVMALNETMVNVIVYVATPERVILGTLTGPS